MRRDLGETEKSKKIEENTREKTRITEGNEERGGNEE
jgi:hypothetical protein